MKALTDDELRMNQEAVGVAAAVLGESVEAATRCEQVTQDMQLEAAGVGAVNRGFVKGARGLSKVMMPRTMGGMKQMETGGLPKSFVLAVTADKVHALEDKQDGGQLVAGKVLESWDRATFTAKRGDAPGMNRMTGIPEDRQMLIIYLPLEGSKSKYMQAAAEMTAAAGGPGMPHKMAVARDDASEKVLDAITANAPAAGANVVIGGQRLDEMMAQAAGAQAAADPTEQLARLADLHERGALTDEEFAAQKAKILGAG
jgi:Short C-terminal domain